MGTQVLCAAPGGGASAGSHREGSGCTVSACGQLCCYLRRPSCVLGRRTWSRLIVLSVQVWSGPVDLSFSAGPGCLNGLLCKLLRPQALCPLQESREAAASSWFSPANFPRTGVRAFAWWGRLLPSGASHVRGKRRGKLGSSFLLAGSGVSISTWELLGASFRATRFVI